MAAVPTFDARRHRARPTLTPPRPPTRPLSEIVVVGTLPNRALRLGLAAATVVSILGTAWSLLRTYPLTVDLEIPLRATQRWIHGAPPYLASSFQVTSGPGQPFLYPPFLLPLLAPFAALPQAPVALTWALVSVAAALWTCRRLGLPWWSWPIALAWPPFAQALLGLNVQVLLFAAFVALFYDRPAAAAQPSDQDLARSPRPAAVDGALAACLALLKTSQLHPWLYLARRRPRAALLGLAVAVALVLATLPFTGLGLWFDWLAQVRHAAQPGLAVGGISLLHDVPLPLALAIDGATLLLVFAVPAEHAGAWVGLLTLVGSPNLHVFGLLFALPALLAVRREIGLAAALAISFYTVPGAWTGVALVAGALLLSTRWPALLEPARPAGPASRGGDRSGDAPIPACTSAPAARRP